LLDIYTFGWKLVGKSRLAKDDSFAGSACPLIDYDATSGSHLTETFVLKQTLGQRRQ